MGVRRCCHPGSQPQGIDEALGLRGSTFTYFYYVSFSFFFSFFFSFSPFDRGLRKFTLERGGSLRDLAVWPSDLGDFGYQMNLGSTTCQACELLSMAESRSQTSWSVICIKSCTPQRYSFCKNVARPYLCLESCRATV